MKRIETKRPSVLGLPGRHSNGRRGASTKTAHFTPQIDSEIMARAEIRADKDGFPYLRDVVQVLFTLYGSGRMDEKLGRNLPRMIARWVRRAPDVSSKDREIVKRNFKLRREHYERALKRWRQDAPEQAHTATAMCAFLLESYGDGDLKIGLWS